jgi:large subunit ribosomal protein L6
MMSRVGQAPVAIPSGVQVSITDDVLTAKGKLGEESVKLSDVVEVTIENDEVRVKPCDSTKFSRAMWGTTRNLVRNAITGVSEGFTRRLVITGVGYRAQVQGSTLNLQLGYSHDINYPVPQGIKVALEGERGGIIAISGPNKQRVGQMASEIRAFRKPEPYKGKGVRYDDEFIFRKEGKKK